MQRAGRLKIPGEFYKFVRCSGTPRHWSARVVSPVGTYARGLARVKTRLEACGPFECGHEVVRHRVRLLRAAKQGPTSVAVPGVERLERPRPLADAPRRWPGTP
jgi:hypothetical protein